MSEIDHTNTETKTTAPEVDPVAQVIDGVDISTIKRDDVFADIIHQSKLFSFRLMVACGLLERILIRDNAPTDEKQEPTA
jgi:hypothetical protein